MKVILTRGIIGSGKSYWAKQFVKDNQDYKRVNRDEIRHMLSSYTFDEENEKLVTHIEKHIINDLISCNYNLVIDKMNLNEKYFNDDMEYIRYCFKAITKKAGIKDKIEIEVKDFPITLEEAIERDSKRDFIIGEKVIRDTWKRYKDVLESILKRKKEII